MGAVLADLLTHFFHAPLYLLNDEQETSSTTWVLLVQQALAQTAPLWRRAAAPAARSSESKSVPTSWFTLDAAQLTTRLATAPPETRRAEAVTVELPYCIVPG